MLRLFTGITLRLLRVATNTFFCFEFNRFLGRATRGTVTHRKRVLPRAEAALLSRIHAPVVTLNVRVPGGLLIHTIVAGKAAAAGVDRLNRDTLGDDHPIILFHGHSMFGATFYRNVDDLLRLGFTSVYMPDLPGFGRSSRPVFTDEGNADAAIDYFAVPMLAWMRALRFKRHQHVTLGGHSLGGYIAHECALRLSSSSTASTTNTPSASTCPRSNSLICTTNPNLTTTTNADLTTTTRHTALPASAVGQDGHRRIIAGGDDEDDGILPSCTPRRLIMIAPAAIRRPARMAHALWFSMTPQRLLTYGGLVAQLLFASSYPSSPEYNEPGMRQFALMSNSISARSGDAAAAAILNLDTWSWKAECVRPLLERTRRLACPVHLVAGTKDALVSVDALRELQGTLATHGNQVAISVVHDADHCPHILKPAAFARAVARFDVSLRVVNGRIERLAGRMADQAEATGVNKRRVRTWQRVTAGAGAGAGAGASSSSSGGFRR